MAKRFTDTDKWKKPFIRGLQGAYKLLWLYIIDDCDHAGIWQVDMDVAEIRIGEKLDIDIAVELFGNKIHVFNDAEKWFIPDFIEFQYGILNKENKAHNSVIQKLTKYKIKHLTSSLEGAKDKDKELDMDKDKEKGVPTQSEVEQYFIENGYSKQSGAKAFNYYNVAGWKDSRGRKVLAWKQKVRGNWFKPENEIKTQSNMVR